MLYATQPLNKSKSNLAETHPQSDVLYDDDTVESLAATMVALLRQKKNDNKEEDSSSSSSSSGGGGGGGGGSDSGGSGRSSGGGNGGGGGGGVAAAVASGSLVLVADPLVERCSGCRAAFVDALQQRHAASFVSVTPLPPSGAGLRSATYGAGQPTVLIRAEWR